MVADDDNGAGSTAGTRRRLRSQHVGENEEREMREEARTSGDIRLPRRRKPWEGTSKKAHRMPPKTNRHKEPIFSDTEDDDGDAVSQELSAYSPSGVYDGVYDEAPATDWQQSDGETTTGSRTSSPGRPVTSSDEDAGYSRGPASSPPAQQQLQQQQQHMPVQDVPSPQKFNRAKQNPIVARVGVVGEWIYDFATLAFVRRWFTYFMELIYRMIVHTPRAVRFVLTTAFVYAIRYHVDTFWTWVEWNVWVRWKGAYAQDSRPVMEGIDRVEWKAYGPHPKEICHVIVPDRQHAQKTDGFPDGKAKHVLYFHGGGFVFANISVLFHSITCIARAGPTVFSFDYPLAPEDRFPEALVSTLRALHWTHSVAGVDNVMLFGDSAGANLVMMAAAFVCNRALLEDFASSLSSAQLRDEILGWSFPSIESIVSMYGLLDQHSWRGRRLKQITILENYIAEGGIAGALELYQPLDEPIFSNKITFVDLIDDVQSFPRTLFVAGSQDPLIYSTLTAHHQLRLMGFDVHCKIYRARHGFFGFPPQWTFGAWVHGARPACELLCRFFGDCDGCCGSTATGSRCCEEHNGDFGIHALRAYDREYSEAADMPADDALKPPIPSTAAASLF